MKLWLRRYGGNLFCVLLLVGMLLLIWIILAGDSPDKPAWLLLPVTGIYVLVSLYMAAGAIQAAQASRRSVEVMEATLVEMRLSRQMQYSPWFSFPCGAKCLLTPDGSAHIELRNLFRVPIAGLWIMLWELETSSHGKVVKYSSMRESVPRDYSADEREMSIVLSPSGRTDDEKLQIATMTAEQFERVYGRPPQSSLCLIAYYVAGEPQPRSLFYDLMIEDSRADSSRDSSY